MAKPLPVWADEPYVAKAPWHASNAMYLAGQAVLDEADAIGSAMERKWGVDRLRLLVSTEIRERFDRQRLKLDMAIRQGELEDVRREAGRMVMAWRFLDQEATAAGHPVLDPQVWEFVLPDGSVAAIVRDRASLALTRRDSRAMAVYTLDEITRLLSAFPAVAKAKELWGGAEVVAVREPRDPLEGIEDFDDSIPF